MKLTDKPSSKNLIIVMAVIVCAVLAVGGTFAAYTSQGYMRGVARNRDGENIRFSSNYLKNCTQKSYDEDAFITKVLSYTNDAANESSHKIDVYVYNYVQGNMNLVNENDITYDMEFTFAGGKSDKYSIVLRDEDDKLLNTFTAAAPNYEVVAENVTLMGRQPHAHHYEITISGADLDNVKITAVAKPKNMSSTGNQLLAAVLIPSTKTTSQDFSCTGTFADRASGSPKDYDAFNYEVTISTGRANVTITWDPAKIEIDPFFIEKLKNRTEDAGCTYDKSAGTLTFIMDQSKGTGDYMIPFYLTSPQSDLPESWDDMTRYIKGVSGTQINGDTTSGDNQETN